MSRSWKPGWPSSCTVTYTHIHADEPGGRRDLDNPGVRSRRGTPPGQRRFLRRAERLEALVGIGRMHAIGHPASLRIRPRGERWARGSTGGGPCPRGSRREPPSSRGRHRFEAAVKACLNPPWTSLPTCDSAAPTPTSGQPSRSSPAPPAEGCRSPPLPRMRPIAGRLKNRHTRLAPAARRPLNKLWVYPLRVGCGDVLPTYTNGRSPVPAAQAPRCRRDLVRTSAGEQGLEPFGEFWGPGGCDVLCKLRRCRRRALPTGGCTHK